MDARVTIITPCYNGEKYLCDYFESIIAQTYNNIELIFVNDGSTDCTEEIVHSYHEKLEQKGYLFKYVYQDNGGQAKAMNAGFQLMTGQYLIWPDADDTLSVDSIEKRVRFLENNPEYDFVRSSGYYFDPILGKRIQSVNFNYYNDPAKEDIFLDLIEERTFCACGCYMIKTSMFRSIYPEMKIYETEVGQNWQILIPIAGRGKCGYLDEEQYRITVHADSHSKRKRSTDELIRRQEELKTVLKIGLSKANRQDLDYNKIIDDKYLHIFFQINLLAERKQETKVYYKQLKKEGILTIDEEICYLKKWYPCCYIIYYIGVRLTSLKKVS